MIQSVGLKLAGEWEDRAKQTQAAAAGDAAKMATADTLWACAAKLRTAVAAQKTPAGIGEKGFLEVGSDGAGMVVMNHPQLVVDENGVGHVVFSPSEARGLANLLTAKAAQAEAERS